MQITGKKFWGLWSARSWAEVSRVLPSLVELVLVLMLAWLLAGLWSPAGEHGKAAMVSPHADGEVSSMPALAALLKTPIFGHAAVTAVKKRVAVKAVVASTLHISLLGTIAGGSHAAAVVRVQGSAKQRLVRLGASLMPGVTLKRVEADSIVVQRGDRLERIAMEKGHQGRVGLAPVVSSSSQGGAVRHFSRTSLNQQLHNLPALLGQARAFPYKVNGQSQGFKIQEIVPGSLYAKAGLKNGDVIQRVNGKPVTTMQQGMALYQALQHARAIDLQIVRGGQPRSLHYVIQ